MTVVLVKISCLKMISHQFWYLLLWPTFGKNGVPLSLRKLKVSFYCSNFIAVVVGICWWTLDPPMMDVLYQSLKSDCGRWVDGWQLMAKLSMLQSLGRTRMTLSMAMSGQSDQRL